MISVLTNSILKEHVENTKYVTDILNDQATTLEELIHHDSIFPEGSLVLEAGCGVGA